MDFNDDRHLDVCQAIEIELKAEYEIHPELTDTLCVFGLENAIIATKKEFGFARSERVTDHPLLGGIIERCVAVGLERIGKVNALTLKDYVARIDKIKKSVIRHSEYGARSYYDFIKKYV
ncbi:MAG: hypothetical protein JNM42_16710 [Propionivibrio sp.]|uniref:hypothetical protein n=1 Tax=Propionivibrio sp. TaxID=2212460 RepID=UPI001A3B61E2|nr:hypothetical protein [Propionivibrio sp.]MBL8416074.1 hypothetical protein [Propionivibrio sp.]